MNYSIKDIEKVVKGINGKILKTSICRLTAPGENYLSLVFRIDFEIEKNGQIDIISTVAKCLPLGENRLEFNATAMRNEIRWYAEMVPILEDCGEEFGIETDFYPKYLGGRLSLDPSKTSADRDSILILENLIPQGYKNEDRHIGFDLNTSKTILKQLARFHAIPLGMKFKKPDHFKRLKDYLDSGGPPRQMPSEENKPPHDLGPAVENKVLERMLKIPACQPYISNIEAVKLKPKGPPTWHKSGFEPWNTVLHTDYWLNNIMVKTRDEDEPLIKMVDFQMCCYSSYAKDLVFFLLTSLNSDVQQNCFDELLKYYYDQFTPVLNTLHVPQLKLSYEDFLEEVKRVAVESEFCHAIFFSTIIFGEKGAGPDIVAGEGDKTDHLDNMIKNMTELQKEKLAIMTVVAAKRKWI